MSREVTQSDNSAGRDIIGGDKADGDVIKPARDYIETQIIEAPPTPLSPLSKLFKKLASEASDDSALCAYISELEIYTRVVKDETVVGLDGKFLKANRIDQLDMAKRMKEEIYAKLHMNMFSKTFQTIYATLMAKVFEEFDTWVRPAIAKGLAREEIDALVSERVVKPIAQELDQCDEFDGVAIATVRGMVYFLTGNCHLVWH